MYFRFLIRQVKGTNCEAETDHVQATVFHVDGYIILLPCRILLCIVLSHAIARQKTFFLLPCRWLHHSFHQLNTLHVGKLEISFYFLLLLSACPLIVYWQELCNVFVLD